MVKHNTGLRPIDLERIAGIKIMADIDTTTGAIREALRKYEATADPVQWEAARKQARKISKEQTK